MRRKAATNRDRETNGFTPPVTIHRSALSEQASRILLESIRKGDLSGKLPPEKDLCRQLGIGRNTVRQAIHSLITQGVIRAGGKGRQHEIVDHSASPEEEDSADQIVRNVRYLSTEPFHELGEITSEVYQTLTESLRAANRRLVFECRPGLTRRFSRKEIESLTSLPNTIGWILHRQPESVQRWFAGSGIPTVVTGSVFPGILLPSVSYDIEALASHAAHEFLRHGHREIAFVTPASRTASEQECVDAFVKTVSSRQDAMPGIIEHGPDIPSISRGILASRLGSKPTTAYFIMAPDHAISVLTLLLSAGVKIPRDVSLICVTGAKIMSAAVPSIAYYRLNPVALGKTAARILNQRIEGKRAAADNLLVKKIIPSFVGGDSLGQCP